MGSNHSKDNGSRECIWVHFFQNLLRTQPYAASLTGPSKLKKNWCVPQEIWDILVYTLYVLAPKPEEPSKITLSTFPVGEFFSSAPSEFDHVTLHLLSKAMLSFAWAKSVFSRRLVSSANDEHWQQSSLSRLSTKLLLLITDLGVSSSSSKNTSSTNYIASARTSQMFSHKAQNCDGLSL
jgi:hypothetical protein